MMNYMPFLLKGYRFFEQEPCLFNISNTLLSVCNVVKPEANQLPACV